MSNISRERVGLDVRFMDKDTDTCLCEQRLPISSEDLKLLKDYLDCQEEWYNDDFSNVRETVQALLEKITFDNEWEVIGLIDDMKDIVDSTKTNYYLFLTSDNVGREFTEDDDPELIIRGFKMTFMCGDAWYPPGSGGRYREYRYCFYVETPLSLEEVQEACPFRADIYAYIGKDGSFKASLRDCEIDTTIDKIKEAVQWSIEHEEVSEDLPFDSYLDQFNGGFCDYATEVLEGTPFYDIEQLIGDAL